MEYVAPLIQTVLWVALIGGIIWRFHLPIHGLLTALQKRVESGSTLKAGPFELVEQLRPQPPEQQKEKVRAELLEATSESPMTVTTEHSTSQASANQRRRAQLLQAEDLVLRAIQSEYGQPISRQLAAGPDVGFDGAFTVSGRLNLVEVKYVSTLKSIPRLRDSLTRIARTIATYSWRNVQLILAVVFENADDIPDSSSRLAAAGCSEGSWYPGNCSIIFSTGTTTAIRYR